MCRLTTHASRVRAHVRGQTRHRVASASRRGDACATCRVAGRAIACWKRSERDAPDWPRSPRQCTVRTDAMRIEDHDPADASHARRTSEVRRSETSHRREISLTYMLNVTPRSSHLNEPLGNTRTQTRQSTKPLGTRPRALSLRSTRLLSSRLRQGLSHV